MGFRIAVVSIFLLVGASGIAQTQNWNDGNWNRDNWNRDSDRREDYRGNDRWGERRDDRDSPNDNRDVTELQKRACRPDVFRLCSWYIPNRDAITACLHSNIDKLNADCRAVMEGRLR